MKNSNYEIKEKEIPEWAKRKIHEIFKGKLGNNETVNLRLKDQYSILKNI